MAENSLRSNKNIPKNLRLPNLPSGHTISWESSAILRTSTSWPNRRLLEAWKINSRRSPLNRDDILYLPQEYRALTLLDNTLFGFLLATIRILNKLVPSLYFFTTPAEGFMLVAETLGV